MSAFYINGNVNIPPEFPKITQRNKRKCNSLRGREGESTYTGIQAHVSQVLTRTVLPHEKGVFSGTECGGVTQRQKSQWGLLDTRFNQGQHVLLSKIITDNKFFSLWCFSVFRNVLVYHRITITYSGTGTALMDPEQNQSYSLSQWRMRNKDMNTP